MACKMKMSPVYRYWCNTRLSHIPTYVQNLGKKCLAMLPFLRSAIRD